ncbi:hypothetical protein MNV84_08203 [Leishmania braziliensis]|nr:hypothetical protein MNV84_08203 [Leishmania braziliensis]
MEDACPFQPHINPRSRRLARYAPTLRERQEHDGQRRSASRGESHVQRQCGAPTPRPETQAFIIDTENDVVERVWDLWHSVATREAREPGAALVRRVHSVNSGDTLPQRRPRVVYVRTVLGMLNALGITSPQHDALITKFLTAMALEGGASEAFKQDETVDAAQFIYVFSTVWRAAVTNRTRWSPTSAQVSVSSPVAQQRDSASSGATMHHPYAGSDSHRVAPLPRMKAVPVSEPTAPEVDSSGSSASAGNALSASSSSVVWRSREGGKEEAHTDTESTSPSTNSDSGDERRVDVAECDADLLHTNVSHTSSTTLDSAEKPQAGVRGEERSPMAMEPPAVLDPSPEERNPGEPVITTPTHPSATSRTHHRSPFAAASCLCSTPVSHSRRTSSSFRAIPSDSHLLSSTASRELKRATKRVPGGLMRECTFKPAINSVCEQRPVSLSNTAIVQRRKPASTPLPTFQPNIQQLYQARDSLAWWTRQPFNHSDGNRAEAVVAPLTTSLETAVRRMIAARQRAQSLKPSLQKASCHSVPAARSAVRAPVAHLAKPLLYVDVDLPHGRQERLALHAGDNIRDVAQRFSTLHGLTDSLCQRLVTALTAELRAIPMGKEA